MKKNFSEWLEESKIDFSKNFQLSVRSWLKAGGIIKLFIKPRNENELIKILQYLKKNNLNYYILGNISNTILRDGVIETPIINLSNFNKIHKKENISGLDYFVESGVSIPRFSNWVSKNNYTGAEGLLGIPGSIGGGIYMNASSYGDELTKFIVNVKIIDSQTNIFFMKKKDIKLNWRKSIFHNKDFIIVGANFFIPIKNHKNSNYIEYKINKIKGNRSKYQEKTHPNLGSLFATKDIYSDLKFVCFKFFYFFIYHKILTILINNKIVKKDITNLRKKINFKYKEHLGLNSFKNFSLSDKTINCLINKGAKKSNEAIALVKIINDKTGNRIKLENILLDKIK